MFFVYVMKVFVYVINFVNVFVHMLEKHKSDTLHFYYNKTSAGITVVGIVAFTLVKPSHVQDNQHLCLVFCFM